MNTSFDSGVRTAQIVSAAHSGFQSHALLESIVSESHACTDVTLDDLIASAACTSQLLVIASSLEHASEGQLAFLQDYVRSSHGVLVLLGDAGRYPASSDFSSFLGVRVVGQAPKEPLEVRIYPHFLTWGLPERISTELAVYRFDEPHALKASDSIFYELDGSRYPIAYERVFEGGGRVLYLGLDSEERDFESALLRVVLTNLRQFGRPFDSELTLELRHAKFKLDRFRDGYHTEKPSEVSRWLQLVNASTGSSIYAHSSLFLPLTPDVYTEKLRHWHAALAGGEDMAMALRKSLTSVEIRATDFCDEDCYFCYNRKSRPSDYVRQAISPEHHQELEDSLLAFRAEGNLFAVRYTGAGEPLRHPRTLPSLYRFAEANIPTCLITNGRALRVGDCEHLGERATMLRFSINAGSPDIYEQIHRVPGKVFSSLLERIRKIHETRVAMHRRDDLLIGATFLICPENHTEIVSFCEQLRACGVDTVWLRACDNMADLNEVQLRTIDAQIREAHSLTRPDFTVFSKQFEVLQQYFSLHYRHEDITCWSAMTKAFIQPNGEVRICLSRKDFVLGRVDTDDFFDIWSGPVHRDFVAGRKWDCFGPCIERRFNSIVDFLDQNREGDLHRGMML